jgi:alanine dehydrogenase
VTPEAGRPEGILLLGRQEIALLLDLDACIAAVERAFVLHAEGRTLPPAIAHVPAQGGGFHVKAAGVVLERTYVAVKTNGNFPGNQQRHGLPSIQGVILLFDGEKGSPLAILDSIEITILRTGAATAVAAKHLARADARIATICGCGNQGRVQLRALGRVRPIERAYAWDRDASQANRFAREMNSELGIPVEAIGSPASGTTRSDICVTCTPSRQAYLMKQDVPPGAFVAAVGADGPEKQELDPALLAASKIVVDLLEQCATSGELHHALDAGLVTRAGVYAELAEVVAGRKPGRTSDDEIIVFDSTGTGLQDVAAAVAVYEKALRVGVGQRIVLVD